jgi:hypothetical protein
MKYFFVSIHAPELGATQKKDSKEIFTCQSNFTIKEGRTLSGNYKIVRHYKDINKAGRTIKTGLSLEEAQAHCRRADTKDRNNNPPEWFDGYEKESQ